MLWQPVHGRACTRLVEGSYSLFKQHAPKQYTGGTETALALAHKLVKKHGGEPS
jgi:hypothetical protein